MGGTGTGGDVVQLAGLAGKGVAKVAGKDGQGCHSWEGKVVG